MISGLSAIVSVVNYFELQHSLLLGRIADDPSNGGVRFGKALFGIIVLGFGSFWWFLGFCSIFVTFGTFCLLHVDVIESYINWLGPFPYMHTDPILTIDSGTHTPPPNEQHQHQHQPLIDREPTPTPSFDAAIGRHHVLTATIQQFESAFQTYLVPFWCAIIGMLILDMIYISVAVNDHYAQASLTETYQGLIMIAVQIVGPIAFILIPAAYVTSRCDDIIAHVNLCEGMCGRWTTTAQAVPLHVTDSGSSGSSSEAAGAGASGSAVATGSKSWTDASNIVRFTQYLIVRDTGYRIFKIKVSPTFVKALASAIGSLFLLVWSQIDSHKS